jgi:hypothetical protein
MYCEALSELAQLIRQQTDARGILQLKRARFKSYFPAALPRRKAAGGDGCRAGLGSSAAPARLDLLSFVDRRITEVITGNLYLQFLPG